MTTDLPLGTRVVLRYRLPPGSSHPLTDVVGELVGRDPFAVRDRHGRVVRVDADRVVALKPVPPRPQSPRPQR